MSTGGHVGEVVPPMYPAIRGPRNSLAPESCAAP